MTNFSDIVSRVEAIETKIEYLLLGRSTPVKENTMTLNAASIANTALPLVATGIQDVAAAQTTLDNTTGTLSKIEEGLTTFLKDAPPLVTAINPAAGAMATGIANGMLALLGLLQDLHSNTTAPAVAAAVASTPAPETPNKTV